VVRVRAFGQFPAKACRNNSCRCSGIVHFQSHVLQLQLISAPDMIARPIGCKEIDAGTGAPG